MEAQFSPIHPSRLTLEATPSGNGGERANARKLSFDEYDTGSVVSLENGEESDLDVDEFAARQEDTDGLSATESDVSVETISAIERENALFDVVVKMRRSLGNGKHRRRFTKHRNCFTGRQAVQWLVASGIVRTSEAAVRLGNELMHAKLIVGVTKGARDKFEKRSHLYAYHLGVGPGISAARYYVSTEMLAMESRMKTVQTVVNRHTAAVEALSSEHAAAMERVEQAVATIKLELSVLRASVVALVVYIVLPFFKTDAMALASFFGLKVQLESILVIVSLCAAAAVVGSSILGVFYTGVLTRQQVYENTTTRDFRRVDMGAASDDEHIQPLRSLKQQESSVIERQPSFLVASASMLQRTASRLMGPHTQPMRPEDRAGPPPSIPPEDWVDKPCALRFVPSDAQVIRQEGQLPDSMVRAQIPFEIDSEIFKGRMVVYVRGLTNTPSDIFAGKARTIQLAIQGKFKREIPMDDCVIGQCLSRPLQNLPSRWLLALCARVVQGFGEKWGIELSMPTAERPFMLAPIALAAQAMSCEYEGDVQDIEGSIIENVDAMSDVFPAGVTASKRQKILKGILRKSRKGLAKMPVFDTERVWTFGFWQSQINFMTYRIDLGIGIFNLIRIMDGQPLCFCSSTRAGHILFRMEVWHQELMKGAEAAYERESKKNRPRRSSIEFRSPLRKD